MKVLLDTHYLIWLSIDESALNVAERNLLRGPRDTLVVSAVSFWEVRLKRGRFHVSGRRVAEVAATDLVRFADSIGVNILPFTPAHAVATLASPLVHRDPFDEMLLLQAQEEGLKLLTRDRLLRDHPLVLRL